MSIKFIYMQRKSSEMFEFLTQLQSDPIEYLRAPKNTHLYICLRGQPTRRKQESPEVGHINNNHIHRITSTSSSNNNKLNQIGYKA